MVKPFLPPPAPVSNIAHEGAIFDISLLLSVASTLLNDVIIRSYNHFHPNFDSFSFELRIK
jgi:hypothetical protein